MFLNIAATAVPTFVLQLIILPQMARNMTDERYGLLVTILALLNIVPATLGNALNNVRLIYEKEEEKSGDYNALLLILSFINLIVVAAITYLYEREITFFSLFLIVIASVLWLVREYYIVAFRIKINYVNILISNLSMVAGYAIGYYLFRLFGHWQYIYILGLLCSLGFIFLKSDLWKEPCCCGKRFGALSTQTTLLALALFMARIPTYADKLLIFPILGGATVSVYYTATLFGKVISLAITPISGVMLSYLSKLRRKNDNVFRMTFLCAAVVCFVGYFACVAISRPVLILLYPQFVNEAMKYIWITTGTAILSALISIINPFVLRFFLI